MTMTDAERAELDRLNNLPSDPNAVATVRLAARVTDDWEKIVEFGPAGEFWLKPGITAEELMLVLIQSYDWFSATLTPEQKAGAIQKLTDDVAAQKAQSQAQP